MKIQASQSGSRRHSAGLATLVAIVLLGALSILVTADFVAVRSLKSDLKLIEKRQIQRIDGSHPGPNSGNTNTVSHGQN